VCRDQDSLASALQLFDQAVDLKSNLRIKSGGRLIQKDQVGIVDHRKSKSHALFLTA